MDRRAPRLPLVCNISFDRFPVTSLADRGKVETVAPELTAPQVLFERGELVEEFACGDGFEDTDDLGAAVLWWE